MHYSVLHRGLFLTKLKRELPFPQDLFMTVSFPLVKMRDNRNLPRDAVVIRLAGVMVRSVLCSGGIGGL
jgi:hypothetical protein